MGVGIAACSAPNNGTSGGRQGGTGSSANLGGYMGIGGGPGGGVSGVGQGGGFIQVVTDAGKAPISQFAGGAMGAGGSAPIPPATDQPVVVNECPTTPDPALAAGGPANGARLLYPYDGTIFPAGLLPPTMQWSQSGTADVVFLHMKSSLFEYTGCFGANAQFQLPIPATAWTAATQQTGGASDPITVELNVKSGGSIFGFKQTIVIARGKLKGDLFYNTYTSPLAQKQAGNPNGAVMRLHFGAAAPEVLLTDTGAAPVGPCWSCHSLSANGNVLVAQHHNYNFITGASYNSASFDLRANPGLSPPPKTQMPSATAEMGLGAVYPDGTKVLTMGSPGNSSTASTNPFFPDAVGNVPAMIGAKDSMLLDTATGAQITLNGWNVKYAKMPSFSPDGTMVAFNWHEDPSGPASGGHSLAVANFDTATNTMSNVRVIYKNDTLYPGWPFFTPDNLEVVFVLGDAQDYVSAYPGRAAVASSQLWTVDVATQHARPLSRANGYMTPGAPTYLPVAGRDEHLEFFPTITPIAAGGYFWVFFTSRRTYGNIMTAAVTAAPGVLADPISKKIWVSAFNIRNGALIEDPSNPPFYLPGQEPEAGNIRAFAALEPCHDEGGTCETGVDCCKGHCYMGKCGVPPPPPPPPPGEPPPPPRCSEIDEQCASVSDCCNPKNSPKIQCVRYFCEMVEPPK